jgi:hypothetical protein
MDLVSLYWYMKANARQKSMAYLDAYQQHFSHLRGSTFTLIEIGCGYPSSRVGPGAMPMGGSLRMWREYFGAGCRVVGIDIIDDCKEFQDPENNIFVEIGDQADQAMWSRVLTTHGSPTIVIDDGSHRDEDVIRTFEILYPELSSSGFYAIEDMAGSHVNGPEFHSWESDERFINISSRRHVMQLNQAYTSRSLLRREGKDLDFPATSFGFTTAGIFFYPNLVIYKRGHNVPFDQIPGPPHYTISV